MGTSIEMECNNCHFSFEAFLGIGFRFPQVYQDTINAAKEGKFGEIVQSFLLEHPDGALNCNMVLLQCTSCDELDKSRDLSMYIPKDKPATHDGIWSVAFPYKNASYESPRDLKDHYRLIKSYDHICRKCGGKMRPITEENLTPESYEPYGIPVNVNCPKCHKPMTIGGYGMWD